MKAFKIVLLLFILCCAIAAPAYAVVPDAEILDISYDDSTCIFTVVWRANIAEQFSYFVFYNKQNVIANGIFEAAAGEIFVVSFKAGEYVDGANVMGFLIEQLGNEPDYEEFEFAPTPCLTGEWEFVAPPPADCPYPMPANSVIYSLPLGAQAYYAADPAAATDFSIPAGTWYVSEFSGDFAKLWIACEARPVWVVESAIAQ